MITGGEELTIRAIASGGDGVATLADGRAVFVPRSAPGDRVRVAAVRRRARFARAEIGELIQPSAERVEPPCAHYTADRCGSCQIMHLSANAQRQAKRRIAGDALRRIGHLDATDPEITPAPDPFGYRTKITFAMQRGTLGYHRLHQPDEVFDVVRCPIATPAVQSLHAAVRYARTLLPRHDARVVLRTDRQGALHVVVRTLDGNAWTGGKALRGELQRQRVDATIWWHTEGAKPRILAGDADTNRPMVFEQVYPAMGDLVRRRAIAALGDVTAAVVWDLYAGAGETTALLHQAGALVTSAEIDPRAVALAEADGPCGPARIAGRVEDVVAGFPAPRLIVTNPPRTGMDPRAVDAMAQSGADRIAYISCDPATLARDLRRLDSRYRLVHCDAFDQFPQTAHLECLAVLERR